VEDAQGIEPSVGYGRKQLGVGHHPIVVIGVANRSNRMASEDAGDQSLLLQPRRSQYDP